MHDRRGIVLTDVAGQVTEAEVFQDATGSVVPDRSAYCLIYVAGDGVLSLWLLDWRSDARGGG
jgi:hypothetical protein